MGKIQLLDCTLRDGGYINDWKFGKKAIQETTKKMTSSGIDIFEIGFLKDENYDIDRTVFNSVNQISKLIKPKNPNIQYAAMIEVVNPLPLEQLEVRSDDTVDIIRVIVWKRLLKEGFEYCKGVVKKGYKLCVQPARVDQYSYDEFVEMIELFNTIDPMAIYVVDSFGTQTTETIKPYFMLADEKLPPDIALGYHGHNNRLQAFEVAKDLINLNLTRDIIIDASIYGMGRGAGNLHLELISEYLNNNYNKNYNLEPMLYVYGKYLKCIYNDLRWGFTPAYLLAAKYNVNPNYIDCFDSKWNIPTDEIEKIIISMPEEDRIIFSEKKAQKFFKEFSKKKINLAVIVPTCNRWKAVDCLLFNSAHQFKRYGIDLIIYDSSDNDKTEAVVKNFQIDGCNNVIYKHYKGKFDGMLIDTKVIDAYKEYANQYEYLWVCSDGFVIFINDCYEKILKFIKEKNDCIIVDASFRNDGKEKEIRYQGIRDCQKFLRDQVARTTLLGTWIFSSKTAIEIINKYPVDDTNYGLWLATAPYHYFASHTVKAVCYIGNVFGYNTQSSSNSFWNSAGKALDIWAYGWTKAIDQLPTIYDGEKQDALKVEMYDFHPFYLSSLLRMRGNGGLNIKLVNQYKKYLPNVCNTSLWKFYAMAMMPKSIAKYLADNPNKKIVRIIRAFYVLFYNNQEEE